MPDSPIFSEEERSDILRFLGYPDYVDNAATIQLGVPGVAAQVLFTLRASFDKLSAVGRERVREYLCELRTIEREQSEARRRFRATKIGEMHMNPLETASLEGEFMRWRTKLSDAFGVPPNPYSQQEYVGFGGGISGRVIG